MGGGLLVMSEIGSVKTIKIGIYLQPEKRLYNVPESYGIFFESGIWLRMGPAKLPLELFCRPGDSLDNDVRIWGVKNDWV